MILLSQICYNTTTFCIATIFVNDCYPAGGVGGWGGYSLNEGGRQAPWDPLPIKSMGAKKGGLKSMSWRKKGLKLTFSLKDLKKIYIFLQYLEKGGLKSIFFPVP